MLGGLEITSRRRAHGSVPEDCSSRKIAVVTGSGRGLGLAYAKALSEAGAAVVVNDVDRAAADAAVRKIADAGGKAVAVVGSIGDTEAADLLVSTAVREFGHLDVW